MRLGLQAGSGASLDYPRKKFVLCQVEAVGSHEITAGRYRGGSWGGGLSRKGSQMGGEQGGPREGTEWGGRRQLQYEAW